MASSRVNKKIITDITVLKGGHRFSRVNIDNLEAGLDKGVN